MSTMKNVKWLSIKISERTYKKLRKLANKEKRFVSYLLDKAVENYLISKKVMR